MLPFGEVAPVKRRAVAYVIDALIGAAVSVVLPTLVLVLITTATGDILTALLIAAPLYGVLGIAWVIVYTFMQAGRGSIGMRTQGLRLAGASDGAPIGFGRALLRNVIFGLAASIVVGYFTPLFDGSGRFQGWHDRAADAVMLDDRASSVMRSAPTAGSAAQPPASPPSALPAGAPAPTFSQGQSFAELHGDSFARVQAQVQGQNPPPPQRRPAPGLPAAPVQPAAPAASAPTAAATDLPEETVVAPRSSGPLPGNPLISFVPGVTQPPLERPAPAAETPAPPAPPAAPAALPPRPAAAQPPSTPAPPAPAAPASDEDDVESTRISIPGHRLVFTWDDGQRVSVSGRTVFGRNPAAEPGAVVVPVRDETLSLSKTHFEAAAEATGGWVMDRQSTNGTTIIRDGARIDCPPGQRVPVRLGDAIEIGDRIVTIGGYA